MKPGAARQRPATQTGHDGWTSASQTFPHSRHLTEDMPLPPVLFFLFDLLVELVEQVLGTTANFFCDEEGADQLSSLLESWKSRA